jgi:hypothetical protein
MDDFSYKFLLVLSGEICKNDEEFVFGMTFGKKVEVKF